MKSYETLVTMGNIKIKCKQLQNIPAMPTDEKFIKAGKEVQLVRYVYWLMAERGSISNLVSNSSKQREVWAEWSAFIDSFDELAQSGVSIEFHEEHKGQ